MSRWEASHLSPASMQVQPSQEPVIPGGLLRLGPNCPDDVAASTNWTVARFAWGERLAGSAECSLHRAVDKETQRAVVLKVFDLRGAAASRRREAVTEAALHASLDHPAILPLWAAFQDRDFLCLVMQSTMGDLMNIAPLMDRSDRSIAKYVLGPLLSALAYLHGQDIIHRDVKVENVLLGEHSTVYLADFGVARQTARHKRALSEAGTVGCMAPEVMMASGVTKDRFSAGGDRDRVSQSAGEVPQGGSSLVEASSSGLPTVDGALSPKSTDSMRSVRRHEVPRHKRDEYGPAVDIWSLGVLAWDLLVGTELFSGESYGQVLESMVKPLDARPEFGSLSPDAADFIRRCLEWNAVKRPSAAELYNHALIKAHMGDKRWKRMHPSNFSASSMPWISRLRHRAGRGSSRPASRSFDARAEAPTEQRAGRAPQRGRRAGGIIRSAVLESGSGSPQDDTQSPESTSASRVLRPQSDHAAGHPPVHPTSPASMRRVTSEAGLPVSGMRASLGTAPATPAPRRSGPDRRSVGTLSNRASQPLDAPWTMERPEAPPALELQPRKGGALLGSVPESRGVNRFEEQSGSHPSSQSGAPGSRGDRSSAAGSHASSPGSTQRPSVWRRLVCGCR